MNKITVNRHWHNAQNITNEKCQLGKSKVTGGSNQCAEKQLERFNLYAYKNLELEIIYLLPKI